jgi:hypothetical protein
VLQEAPEILTDRTGKALSDDRSSALILGLDEALSFLLEPVNLCVDVSGALVRTGAWHGILVSFESPIRTAGTRRTF